MFSGRGGYQLFGSTDFEIYLNGFVLDLVKSQFGAGKFDTLLSLNKNTNSPNLYKKNQMYWTSKNNLYVYLKVIKEKNLVEEDQGEAKEVKKKKWARSKKKNGPYMYLSWDHIEYLNIISR